MDLFRPPQVLRDALPQAGKDFLDIGWWLVLLILAALVLGVVALESAGVVVDPVTNSLKRLAVKSLK